MEAKFIKTTTYEDKPGSSKNAGFKTEIDTSVPFESVKDAVHRFGGVGYWKPFHTSHPSKHSTEGLDTEKLEEQARVLEKELNLKERETFDVLKELDKTRRLVDDLKSKLQKEESEAKLNLEMSACDKKSDVKENQSSPSEVVCPMKECSMPSNVSSPGLILMELKQAKLNLTKTTHDFADVRATVESLNKKLAKERISLEKTRERLTQNRSKISSLENELNQTRLRLQVAKGDAFDNPTIELQKLRFEAENFRKRRESAQSEVLKTMSEIELTKAKIRTAKIRLVAAKKMKKASRAAEAATLVEINALSNSNHRGSPRECTPKREEITLSIDEYITLTRKARDVEEQSKKRVANAMLEVDEAYSSRTDILKRVDEATKEAITGKKALEEALEKVMAADIGKLEVEEALRKWRSDNHKRRSSTNNNSTKFKNPGPSDQRRDFTLLDVNGLNLVKDEVKPVLKPTLSIGQILSKKLFRPEEFEGEKTPSEKVSVKRKVSLGQMLGKHNDVDGALFDEQVEKEKENDQKQFSAKRKKFGFARFSLLLSKQHKKKKPMRNLR
ncbi:unnamed protein product [Lathyrus sativus]|nr:unnamed protein product [Lathyrus sativus]